MNQILSTVPQPKKGGKMKKIKQVLRCHQIQKK